jgi:RNA polymerase sigma-70 factor (ECF subfamily)
MNQPSPTTDIRRDLVALLPRLRRFALTLAGSGVDADELVREAATRAIQKSHHWKGEGRIENWLFSLIRTTWADEQKKRRRAEHEASGESDSDIRRSTGSIFLLPDGQASAILLTDAEGFSYAEAAAILGITTDLLATRLCAARLGLAAAGNETSERRA